MAANTEISQLLDLVRLIIVVIDSEQKVSYINKKGCEILGYAREDILGKNWVDNFLPEKLRDDMRMVYSKLMSADIELAEYFDNVVLAKNGQEIIIGWHNTLLKNDADKVIGTLSLGEDITDRRRVDEKREVLIQGSLPAAAGARPRRSSRDRVRPDLRRVGFPARPSA